MVTITYGHAKLYDGTDVSVWDGHKGGATATFLPVYGDYFDFDVTAGAEAASCYYHNTTDLVGVDSTYTKMRWRYKTTGAAKAKIQVTFSGGATETALWPATSNTFTCDSVTLTYPAGEHIDKILLHNIEGVGHVYYDFVMIYTADFAVPEPDRVVMRIPIKDVLLSVPGRSGDVTQNLGTGLAEWDLLLDFSTGDWERSGDVWSGQVFLDIAHNSYSEAWQWFDSDLEQCKVRMASPEWRRESDSTRTTWQFTCTLREYRLSDPNDLTETYTRRFGVDL